MVLLARTCQAIRHRRAAAGAAESLEVAWQVAVELGRPWLLAMFCLRILLHARASPLLFRMLVPRRLLRHHTAKHLAPGLCRALEALALVVAKLRSAVAVAVSVAVAVENTARRCLYREASEGPLVNFQRLLLLVVAVTARHTLQQARCRLRLRCIHRPTMRHFLRPMQIFALLQVRTCRHQCTATLVTTQKAQVAAAMV